MRACADVLVAILAQPEFTQAGIKQPTLVVNGSNDVIMPTINFFIMEQKIPNAQLIIYPDSNHGTQHQYPELFVEHATLFLNG